MKEARETVQDRNVWKMLAGKPEGKYHLEDLHTVGIIILKFILGK
jgi:hypothetical protein